MPSDETIRLILDLGASGKNVQEVAAELDKLGDAAKRADAKIDSVSPTVEKVATSSDKAAKSTKDLGRGVIELSQAFQDLVQGGLGGVLNNIDGVVMKFGGTAGLAAGLSVAAVGVYALGTAFKTLWAELAGGSNEVPKATDNLTAMGDALKVNKDRLKDLADQGKLTNADLAEFNRLTAENVQLEKASNAEKERRNTLDALRKKEGAGDAEAGDIATAAITANGGVDKTVNEAEAVLTAGSQELRDSQAKLEALVKHVDGQKGSGYLSKAEEQYLDSVVKYQQGQVDAVRASIKGQAGDLVAGASKGDAKSINALSWMMPGSAMQQATPEGMADAQAFVDKDQADAARIAKSNAKRKADAAMGDALTKQGGQIQADDERARKVAAEKEAKDQAEAIDRQQDEAGKEADRLGKAQERADAKAAQDREKAARDALPGAQLNRQQDQAFQAAAGYAIKNNNGEFGPSQLESIAREAANNTQGLDANSIRQAVYQAAQMTRARMQADLDRQMGRMQTQSDSAFPY